MRYLLDTNSCIYIIKHNPERVRARFAQCKPGEVIVSSVTEAELLRGVYKSVRVDENLANALGFLSRVQVLPFDSTITHRYGQIRADLEKRGQPIGPLDYQIAATALALDLTLVTNSRAEFERLNGLIVEDWTR